LIFSSIRSAPDCRFIRWEREAKDRDKSVNQAEDPEEELGRDGA
jgi:hypothetical protein